MRNHPLDGIEREKLTIRDVRVIPISHVDPEGDLWRSGTYQVWKTDGAITDKKNTSNNDLIGGDSSNLFKSCFDAPT